MCGGKVGLGDGSEVISQNCWRYDPRFNTWSPLPSMSQPRWGGVCVAQNNCIYIIGGRPEYRDGALSTVDRYSIENDRWEVFSTLPKPIYKHAAVVVGEKVYISGGRENDDDNSLSDVFVNTDPCSAGWSPAPSLLKARYNHCMVAIGERLYVIGGHEFLNTDKLENA